MPAATLPVRGFAEVIGDGIGMAPGPDGSLWVAIPSGRGLALALVDASGRPRPGWPIKVAGSGSCGPPLPAEDGSVRILCMPDELNQELNVGRRAFAFSSTGSLLAGWPIDLDGHYTGRVLGRDLVLLKTRFLSDVSAPGQVSSKVSIMTVAEDGGIGSGTEVPMIETCCGTAWTIGPDGVGYGVDSLSREWVSAEPPELSRATAVGWAGVQSGWPVSIDGTASGPAFASDGRVVLTVGSLARPASRILLLDPATGATSKSSRALPITTAESGFDCIAGSPEPPLTADNGAVFVVSEIDPRIYALDASLVVRSGWPYVLPTSIVHPGPTNIDGITCNPMAVPAVGPDSALYLPLQATDSTGSSVTAVGLDGRVRPGWPVKLKKRGAEFWSVVVGPDGTAYALAIEPEAGGHSSATILAIAPDSTVRYSTTIIEP